MHSTPGYGYKVFVQDGRPGVSVHCKTWIDTSTTLDAPDSVIGNWVDINVLIDYNRLEFYLDGEVVETIALPLPFKVSPKTPLVIGNKGAHPVAEGIPDNSFEGAISRLILKRGIL